MPARSRYFILILVVLYSISLTELGCGNKMEESGEWHMGRIKLRGSRFSGNTIVSNYFIDNFMSDANEAQIKIYLYLMRCIEADEAVSVSSIADRFNYTEKDILRSLMYWSKKGIVSLELDGERNVVGITLNDPQDSDACTTSAAPFVIESTAAKKEVPAADMNLAAKPSYSPERLKDFRSRSDIRQLVFAAEQYLGKTLSATDMKSILYMSEELHFSAELIEYLIESCVNNGKVSMKYIEQTALCWSDEGITDISAAREHSRLHNKDSFAVLKEFGITGRNPAKVEADFIEKWKNSYGFSTDIILEAVDRTMRTLSKPSFFYADSILSRWKDAGVKGMDDISMLDASRKDRKQYASATSSSAVTSSGNRFRNFDERQYDFDVLEKELLKN